MENRTHPTVESEKWILGDAFFAAESVRRDFSELVALFQWHLDALGPGTENGQARTHISEAKAAAERGLKLSNELVESMKASS